MLDFLKKKNQESRKFTMPEGLSRADPVSYTHLELLSGAGGNTATKTEQAERLILDLLADGKELASEDIVKACLLYTSRCV